MLRILFSGLIGLALAACTAPAPPIDADNPRASLMPWDGSRSDLIKTPSGLEYVVVTKGERDATPITRHSSADVLFEIWTAANEDFASNFEAEETTELSFATLPDIMDEALGLMRTGDEFVFRLNEALVQENDLQPGGEHFLRLRIVDVTNPPMVADDSPLYDLLPWDEGRDGVQSTESGLQYIVLKEGEGEQPAARDRVSVMYEGALNDGVIFDSSYARGSESSFAVNGVISGWTEGLQLMREGADYVFYIPSELAYGQNPRPGLIQPGDDLVFRVELNSVIKAPPPRPVSTEAWATYTPWDSDNTDIIKTGSGLEYIIIESGPETGAHPDSDDLVAAFYEGRFNTNGEVFDSAYDKGEAALLPVNGVIPGWQEALKLMRPGDRWLIHVPSELGYGDTPRGPIPAGSDLNFEIEIVDIIQQ